MIILIRLHPDTLRFDPVISGMIGTKSTQWKEPPSVGGTFCNMMRLWWYVLFSMYLRDWLTGRLEGRLSVVVESQALHSVEPVGLVSSEFPKVEVD